MSEQDEEEKEIIKYTGNYGGINQESKFWEDLEDMGEEELLKNKIVKIKIYSGHYQGKEAIFGVGIVHKNLSPTKILVFKESLNENELQIKISDFLTNAEFFSKTSSFPSDNMLY